jgi:hypothetical protein
MNRRHVCTAQSNATSTQFAVARSTEEIGGRLHSVSSRDHLVLYASATRDHAYVYNRHVANIRFRGH